MTKTLYLEDSYLRECNAVIVSAKDNKHIALDQTIFYPRGGGQPWDTGRIIRGDHTFNVISVQKSSGEIYHEVDTAGLLVGDRVHCILDWNHRYRLMRSHTASHVLASVLCRQTGALITGNEKGVDQTHIDFNLENFDREVFRKRVSEANKILSQDIPVRWYELKRDEAMKIPGVIKMAEALPPRIPMLRIVEIEGIDIQADGGTHVKNLREVGQIKFLKAENRGKDHRRVYFKLVDTHQ